MLDELNRRRTGFRRGTVILLADGQQWTFPSPPNLSGVRSEGPAGAGEPDLEYEALVGAVVESGDLHERARADLALAIYLLSRNYDLDAGDYQRLLGFAPNGPALASAQLAFGQLAWAHARGLRTRRGPEATEARPERTNGIFHSLIRFGGRDRDRGHAVTASSHQPHSD